MSLKYQVGNCVLKVGAPNYQGLDHGQCETDDFFILEDSLYRFACNPREIVHKKGHEMALSRMEYNYIPHSINRLSIREFLRIQPNNTIDPYRTKYTSIRQ